MTVRDLLQADGASAPTLGETRARVLSVLQGAAEPLGVGEVAERIGLHPNTARFHLDALVGAGAVDRTSEERDQPGRPRTLYRARPDAARVGRRSYRLLAEILTSFVAAQIPHPGTAAVEAGQAWGRYLADRPAPFQRVDSELATDQLVADLGDIGFAPEVVDGESGRQILLHHCPFRETAEEHREVVCGIHLGLMQGLLDAIDAPIQTDKLEPFVRPDVCVAHLSDRQHVSWPHPTAQPARG